MCFDFDENDGSTTTNYNDAGAPETCVIERGASGPSESFAPPFRSNIGSSLRGVPFSSGEYNRVNTGLFGPRARHNATIRFCAKERHASGNDLSYLFSGVGAFRMFTGKHRNTNISLTLVPLLRLSCVQEVR